ncbi:MAG: UbiX family flavin prenyltransferase [bacterium]|nr:UbiX family flavin prenyltransferase [bacterium]
MSQTNRLILGVSGASGVVYAWRMLEQLQSLDLEVHLILTEAAQTNIRLEMDRDPKDFEALAHRVYDNRDLTAAPASGSFLNLGMLVLPCSMSSLAKIAGGQSDNLLTRAADVALKERRKLILCPRETPLSLIHLRNLTTATEAGAIICPTMPAFYHQPQSINDLIDQSLGKILDLLGLEHQLFKRWGEA